MTRCFRISVSGLYPGSSPHTCGCAPRPRAGAPREFARPAECAVRGRPGRWHSEKALCGRAGSPVPGIAIRLCGLRSRRSCATSFCFCCPTALLSVASTASVLLPFLVFVGQRRLGDFGVVFAQSLVRTQLPEVLHLDRQQLVGVVVAGGDPIRGSAPAHSRAGTEASGETHDDSAIQHGSPMFFMVSWLSCRFQRTFQCPVAPAPY